MKFGEQIIIFLQGQRECSLSDIIDAHPDHTPSSVRGTVNLLTKKGVIVRTGKAKYSLPKTGVINDGQA